MNSSRYTYVPPSNEEIEPLFGDLVDVNTVANSETESGKNTKEKNSEVREKSRFVYEENDQPIYMDELADIIYENTKQTKGTLGGKNVITAAASEKRKILYYLDDQTKVNFEDKIRVRFSNPKKTKGSLDGRAVVTYNAIASAKRREKRKITEEKPKPKRVKVVDPKIDLQKAAGWIHHKNKPWENKKSRPNFFADIRPTILQPPFNTVNSVTSFFGQQPSKEQNKPSAVTNISLVQFNQQKS